MPSTSPVSALALSDVATKAVAVDHSAAYLLAIATGGLYFFGFAGMDLWPCSFVALAPLAVALQGRSARACLGLGAIAGFTMNALGMYWLYGTLEEFSRFPAWVCALLTVAVCGYQAGRVALFGWLYGKARECGWGHVCVFALAFVASEVTYPVLVPWYFAASVHQVPALIQLAEVGGPYVVGLVLMVPNLGIAEVWLSRLQHRTMRWGLVALGMIIPLAAATVGALRIEQIDARVAAAEPVRVGLVQANMPLRPRRGDYVEALRRHLQMSRELQLKGVDLAVWSEAALKNLPADDLGYLQRYFRGRLGIPAVVGAFLTAREGGTANAALVTDARGRVIGRYDKQRLLAFAETVPFADIFPALSRWFSGPGYLEPGTSLEPVFVAGHPATVLICYEDTLPVFVNRAVNHGRSEMIINLTNDGWFGDTTAPWIHLALAELRAVEHRRYLVRSTNSGVSAIIDPTGRVVMQGRMFERQILDARVRWMSGPRTGYEILGDTPWWGASALMLFLAFYPKARPGGSTPRARA